MSSKRFFIRSIDADDLFENFLVSAVAAILIIRAYLYVADYPAFGSRFGFHVAHMLWGGLLMFVALLLATAFLDRLPRQLSAFAGGIGFGLFIDELGKFITNDNNYFYQPTIALLYTIFILLFLLLRMFEHEDLEPSEYVVNALERAKQGVTETMNAQEKTEAFALLERAHSDSSVARAVAQLIEAMEPASVRRSVYAEVRRAGTAFYRLLVGNIFFERGVIIFFIGAAIFRLISIPRVIDGTGMSVLFAAVAFVAALGAFDTMRAGRRKGTFALGGAALASFGLFVASLANADPAHLSPSRWSELLLGALSGFFVLAGAFRFPRNRLASYHWFKRAVLVSIFFTQFFVFYRLQLWGLPGLLGDLVAFAVLNYAIRAEGRAH